MTEFKASRGLSVISAAIPVQDGRPVLQPLKLEGEEGINRLFEYRLLLQTPEGTAWQGGAGADIDLDGLIGRELTCQIELEGQGSFEAGVAGGSLPHQGAGVREISALISAARCVGPSGRHVLYELTLRPWLHLASLSTDCKVFQDQSPVQIIEAVLGEYPFASDKRLIESYPQRDTTVQYNESDLEFVLRLMQEWGINHHFEHSGGVHRLIWSDHNGAFQPFQSSSSSSSSSSSPCHHIPYYPPGHKIDREYIHGLSPAHQLTSGSYASRDYDPTRPRALLEARSQAPRPTGHAKQEVYLWRGDRAGLGGSDYSQPNAGADKAANQTEGQGEQLARLRMQALRQGGHRARAEGHLRGIVPGCSFVLTGHPREQANIEYLVLHTRLLIENVGEDSQRDPGQGHHWRAHVHFEVQPGTEALRPEATQRKPKVGGPESARVVGPGGADLHTDALGRIKVQFPWDRYGAHNQNSSCWVRVSSAWAGNQLGAMHIPRIGQEVIVSFLGGDPDLPIVTGCVYNQLNPPPWSLPQQQALSGFRSRELGDGGGNAAAGRSNHLILDDTPDKIQAQLRSDHRHSQLGLGHLSRIEGHAGRQDERGEGFELRTDGHGVIRGGEGLLISTEGRPHARAHAKDMGETTSRLERAQAQHGDLGELAAQHRAQEGGGADQDEVARAIEAQNEAIEGRGQGKEENGRFPELSEPHLVLASPVGIGSTTACSTHQHSGEHHAITAGGHASVSTAKSWLVSAKEAIKLFAHKRGMRLTSAKGNVEIEALRKSVNLLAQLNITQSADSITINAKEEVVVNGGGSYTVWNASGITSGTTGTHTVRAASHDFKPGKSLPVVVREMAEVLPEQRFHVQFKAVAQGSGRVMAHAPYRLRLPDGTLIHGSTDAKGLTQTVTLNHPENVELEWIPAHTLSDPSTPDATEADETC